MRYIVQGTMYNVQCTLEQRVQGTFKMFGAHMAQSSRYNVHQNKRHEMQGMFRMLAHLWHIVQGTMYTEMQGTRSKVHSECLVHTWHIVPGTMYIGMQGTRREIHSYSMVQTWHKLYGTGYVGMRGTRCIRYTVKGTQLVRIMYKVHQNVEFKATS